MKIAVIVVTYNRKRLLLECLEALRKQIQLIDTIYIVDNNSDDGTPQYLFDNKYIHEIPILNFDEDLILNNKVSSFSNESDMINIKYIRKCVNDGGAGGFYSGLSTAYGLGYDWYWLMDDDGRPDKNALKILLRDNPNHDEVLCSLCLSNECQDELSFKYSNSSKEYKWLKELKEDFDNRIEGWGSPFNSILIPHNLVRIVGFPNKRLFMKGDEIDYFYRLKRNGAKISTIVDSIHYHPKNRTEYINFEHTEIFKGGIDWKTYLYYRNRAYVFQNGMFYGFRSQIWKVIKYYFRNYSFLFSLRISIFIIIAQLHGNLGYLGKKIPF